MKAAGTTGATSALIASMLTIALACLPCQPAEAADPVDAANNAGHEMIECAAYFSIVAQGIRNTPKKDSAVGAATYEALSDKAAIYAVNYAQMIKQKPETVVARMELAMKDLLTRMGNDYVNFSILFKEYSDLCVSVMEDPVARFDYWMSR